MFPLSDVATSMKRAMGHGSQVFDEPHEKVIAILIVILVYSFLYYGLYARGVSQASTHFEDTKTENASQQKEHSYRRLSYGHFLWYSAMITFTMPLGDLYPQSPQAKVLTVSQAAISWLILLSY